MNIKSFITLAPVANAIKHFLCWINSIVHQRPAKSNVFVKNDIAFIIGKCSTLVGSCLTHIHWWKTFYTMHTWAQCYKTFNVRNKLGCSSLAGLSNLVQTFVSNARSLPSTGSPEKCFTRAGCSLTQKHFIRLERSTRNKYSSFSRTFVNCRCKRFYNIGRNDYKLPLNFLPEWSTF
jgi:hypothetical protein